MAEVLEREVVKKILKYLNARGGFWFKTHGGPYQRAGIPDIIGCWNGRFVGIEVKRPGRESGATPLQLKTLQKIREAGGITGVVTSVAEVKEILDESTTSSQ